MPFTKRKSRSSTPIPSTEGAQPQGPTLPEQEWKGMKTVLDSVYEHRLADGYDPSKLFHRKVNKRVIPAYYDIIKEPMALSTIKGKINTKAYKNFAEFVRDFALIPHNAQVYNRPDAGAYQDALVVKQVLEAELKKLVEEGVVTEDVVKLPYLGEIPAQDEAPLGEEEEEEDDDEDDDDEDDEADDSDEEGGRRKRKRGPRSANATAKREGGSKADLTKKEKDEDSQAKQRRGRPPKVNTPMEARIAAILKGIRKPRNSKNQLMIYGFDRLPDKTAMPDYYNEIKYPIAYDQLKRKLKRKKYQTVDQFMKDVDTMFENAKQYNQDESQIYKDAVALQIEAHKLAEEEKKKSDSEYVMEEGRIPMPNGILHNGELYKVGDWVHIQNANDLTKPIPCQIYRTWQDSEGGKWVNVCWYYRPEQTVHRFDKHFLDAEVVKTGQYRDHRVDEIVDRCFIMFLTRYFKGRPRGWPADKELYVCASRYNEEKYKMNNIKTWASCLPDEVRDKDYEMDLFEAPRKMKKFPSPIAYLLKPDAKETDEMPKPEWGAENAPPKIGAAHKLPRDPKDSPPPEPTPTPPPQPSPPPPRQTSNMSIPHANSTFSPMPSPATIAPSMNAPSAATRPLTTTRTSYTPSHPQQYGTHSASPAAQPTRPISAQTAPFPPATPQNLYTAPRAAAHPSTYQQHPTTPAATSSFGSSNLPTMARPPQAPTNYRDPPPIEVWTLPDNANASIPYDVRQQFHRDELRRVLFFTTPPINIEPEKKEGAALGHSVRYLAAKARKQEMLTQKRKQIDLEAEEQERQAKKAKMETQEKMAAEVETLRARAMNILEEQLVHAAASGFKGVYGDDWRQGLEKDFTALSEKQKAEAEKKLSVEENAKMRVERERTVFQSYSFLDDGVGTT
ncbi:hypothetical protein LTR66_007256 [Elasticomyces elasticus]|nr:hypothetical protein LTR66_007256 [Elasticomyces elasticus]